MSGSAQVTSIEQQNTATPVLAAPDVTAPDNPSTSAAASPGGGTPDMLTQSEWTRRVIVVGATFTVCLSILGAVGAMVYRVLLDGNAPLTTDITGKLSLIALGGIVAMVAALFGQNNTLSKIIDKLP